MPKVVPIIEIDQYSGGFRVQAPDTHTVPLNLADRIAPQAELHTFFFGLTEPWLLQAAVDRAKLYVWAPDRGPETPEVCSRLRPWDSPILATKRSFQTSTASIHIDQGVNVASNASPLVVHMIEAVTCVDGKSIDVFKTVLFAEWPTKISNHSQLLVLKSGSNRCETVSATPTKLCVDGILAGVWFIIRVALSGRKPFILETRHYLLSSYGFFQFALFPIEQRVPFAGPNLIKWLGSIGTPLSRVLWISPNAAGWYLISSPNFSTHRDSDSRQLQVSEIPAGDVS